MGLSVSVRSKPNLCWKREAEEQPLRSSAMSTMVRNVHKNTVQIEEKLAQFVLSSKARKISSSNILTRN